MKKAILTVLGLLSFLLGLLTAPAHSQPPDPVARGGLEVEVTWR